MVLDAEKRLRVPHGTSACKALASPVNYFDVPFDADFKTLSGGDYNYQLTVPIPDILQRVAGLPISIKFLKVKVGATVRLRGQALSRK